MAHMIVATVYALVVLPGGPTGVVEGTLERFDEAEGILTLVVDDQERTFSIGDQTVFLDWDGMPIRYFSCRSMLRSPGSSVTVTTGTADGKVIVESVELHLKIGDGSGVTLEQLERVREARRAGGPYDGWFWEPGPERLLDAPLLGFELRGPGGEPIADEAFEGKVLLIDFWTPSCGPCHLVAPVVQALHDRYAEAGLAAIAANIDPEQDAEALAYAKRVGPSYAVAVGAGSFAETCKVQGLPTLLVVDRRGIVREVKVGIRSDEDLEAQLVEAIRPLLIEQFPTIGNPR